MRIIRKTTQKNKLKFMLARNSKLAIIVFVLPFLLLKGCAILYGSKDMYLYTDSHYCISIFYALAILCVIVLYSYCVIGIKTLKGLRILVRPAGAFGDKHGISVWHYLVIAFITITGHTSFDYAYRRVNTICHGVVFEGKAVLDEDGRGSGNRFVRVSVESGGEQYRFEGKSEQFGPLLNKEVHIIVYQGLFSKYALVSQP
ncbi:hypothetical protein HR09_03685 [Porphyromonas gulae]|nr:hypothetical protein HR09_03685 [Porphyromonas gulae]